ncbi:MAG: transketolase-like TK C-terminal-containing protein, partial [Acidimicrobiia bacterium]
DPAFAYEMSTIIEHGLQRMYVENEDVFYYLTLYNENFAQPPMPEGVADGIMRGLYRWAQAPAGSIHKATVLFSGTAQAAAREAQRELAEHYDVGVELWSATSCKKLREEALEVERWNRLHPGETPRVPFVTEQLANSEGPAVPCVAVTDYMKMVPDQVARWIPGGLTSLGTDGFGRSDTREALRRFFETDSPHVVVAVLDALQRDGVVPASLVKDAIDRYGIDPEVGIPSGR